MTASITASAAAAAGPSPRTGAANNDLKLTGIIERTGTVPTRIHLDHKLDDEFALTFLEKLRDVCPDAKITSTASTDEDLFEFLVDNKCVYSKKLLRVNPRMDEMLEIAKWMNKGKSFMHMYLCSFCEGGEPNMVIADRRNTPLVKRLVLSCVIQ